MGKTEKRAVKKNKTKHKIERQCTKEDENITRENRIFRVILLDRIKEIRQLPLQAFTVNRHNASRQPKSHYTLCVNYIKR